MQSKYPYPFCRYSKIQKYNSAENTGCNALNFFKIYSGLQYGSRDYLVSNNEWKEFIRNHPDWAVANEKTMAVTCKGCFSTRRGMGKDGQMMVTTLLEHTVTCPGLQ